MTSRPSGPWLRMGRPIQTLMCRYRRFSFYQIFSPAVGLGVREVSWPGLEAGFSFPSIEKFSIYLFVCLFMYL
jgi:hypothetical protein